MKKKVVMILGGGVMQLPAIKIAREKGWKVIVADGNPNAAGATEADVFEAIDLKDTKKLLDAARRHREGEGLDGVFTAGTDFSSSVAYVTEGLGLPGISYETSLNATDKSRMRALFKKHGVPCPDFWTLEKDDLKKLAERAWPYPLVVKPVDNMGARGVVKVANLEDLRTTAEKALELSRAGKVIVEEFIDGPEFSIDALVFRGKVRLCGLADRHIYFPPYFVELGHTMPSRAPEAVLKELEKAFCAGVAALGIENGAAKGDVFYSSKGAMIGEIAARLSGGYMSGWTYPYSSGVRVTEGGLNIAVGLEPGDLEPKRTWTSAERAFISLPGIIAGLAGLEDAKRVEGVKDLFVRAEAGARVKFPENNVEKCGNVISALPTAEAAVEAAETAVGKILLRLAPGESSTESFLFGKKDAFPWAYELKAEERRLLEALPWWKETQTKETRTIGFARVLPFDLPPQERKDWNHRELRSALAALDVLVKGRKTPDWPRDFALGKIFWESFFRGGLQGGLWLLETLLETKDFTETMEKLRRWTGTAAF